MGGTKLCLLLLLGTAYTLAQQEVGSAEGQSPTCFLARRFKNFRRFVYNYEAETLNGVNGATNLKNGPKVSCKVEMEVPQTCSFILRTTECSLSEAVDVDEEGVPVFEPAPGADAFNAAMAKHTLKITIEGQTDVKLFPEEDEPINILNIKRGIVSALLVPVLEEERNKEMATVHGICSTEFTVNSREDIATDVTVTRDLSRCDSFSAQRDHTSPLALISGMHYPLSKLITSTQSCNYKFDNQKKHMTFGTCTEKHIFLPFSHQNEYGVSTLVKQTLSLQEVPKINDRVFDHNEDNVKFLPMEVAEDKAPVQNKDAAIATLRELINLGQTNQGHQRASTFQRLVSELRGLKRDILNPAANEMLSMNTALTWQALMQCGTPECSSAMLSLLRTFELPAFEADVAAYILGMLPNPSRMLVKDMLLMAQNHKSKPIMYGLGNVVRKLYQAEGKVTPEIADVYEFMTSILGADCDGDKELTFLTLRVIGNMGDAMEAVDPAIKSTMVKCMRQPKTTLNVQLAAIQAFRRMSVKDEVRNNLQRVSQYAKGAVQKRIAAYLILMRNPEDSDIEVVKKLLTQEQNMQIKAFVTSHIHNIISSKDPETNALGKKILEALQSDEMDVAAHTEYTTMSRNYKLGMEQESVQANIRGNVVFDPSSQLPREVLLETTLKAFGYNMDMWEVGMEGKGLESTIETLFGKNGFFPDTVSKAMYWAGDKMPNKINEVLEKLAASMRPEGMKKQVPENLVREIVRNFNKLAKDLQTQESPETMAYIRLMGTELGYIKPSDLKGMAQYATMFAETFLLTIPKEITKSLMSGTNNEVFAHYIFMDNKFTLPTASGLPLKFALSGTFAPGATGGVRFSPNMQEVSFMPAVGIEFVTEMGVHVPEFVVSAIEMHTNLYHESALNAKITMGQNEVKLSIPAPQSTTQLFRISNRMLSLTSGQASLIPPKDEGLRTNVVSCAPLFSGVKYCTTARYSVAGVNSAAPYFPLNGETKFAVDIQPTGEVSEYTATIAYELLSEGKEGRQKVDSLKMILRAEGTESEATATMKYNRNRNVLTTNIQIPDYDVETAIRLGMTKSNTLSFDVSSHNVALLSLAARAQLQGMEAGKLQLQLVVPALKTDAALTATMSNADDLTLEIKSEVQLPLTTSIQAITFKYGEELAEVQLMSNMNADVQMFVPYTDAVQASLKQLVKDILDQPVVRTDMKLGHILSKAFEASNIWMDKIATDVPYVEMLRNSVADISMPAMPDNLFMNLDSTFRYRFNKDRMTITIPLPLGGKSSEELRIPSVLTIPQMSLPVLGLELDSRQIPIQTFTVPSEYDLTLPLMGMVDVAAKVNSNYYNWEGMASAGNNTIDSPSYLAKFKVMADSPIELLSFTSEGVAEISDSPQEILKFTIDSSLKHKLIDTSFEVVDTIVISDKLLTTSSYKIQAMSTLGLQTSLHMTSQCSLASDMLTGDANMDGSLTVGSMSASTSYSQSFTAEPMNKEARTESTLTMTSGILEVVNKMKAGYANEQLLIESTTNMNTEPVKHTTKVTIGYKEAQFTIQTDSVTKAENKMLRSQVDLAASRAEVSIRVENQADDTENRAYYLISGSMNPSGMEINGDASINIFESRASHKGTLTLNTNGLTTSCTTTAQSSPMTFENVLHGGVDTAGAVMSITTKGAVNDNKAELNIEGKLATSEVYLNSMFKGNLFDADARNRVNFRVNEDGLSFSNNLVGSLNNMKTDNTHSLTLTLRSLAFHSKSDNFLNEKNTYKHDITVDMEPFACSVIVSNALKIMDASFLNEGQLKAEPYRIDLTGTMMGVISEEELKHTYEITFFDMVLSAKSNTNGKFLGSHVTHAIDMEVAGLSMKFNNMANFNSPYLRLDSTVKAVAEPFTLNIDAIFNTNGAVYLYGPQSGELYSKFLMKAEPLAFTQSFEYRASSTHELTNGVTIKTNMNNKMNSLITLQEQSLTLKMTSKLNDHEFDQEVNAYNNAERMGLELAGAVSTSENHDYSISGFVKYDKNSDSHLIQIPFIEHLPTVMNEVKTTAIRMVDNAINLFKDMDTQFEISSRLHKKVSELKEVIDTFDFNLLVQDLKAFLNKMENHIANLMAKFPTVQIIDMLKEAMDTIMVWIKKLNIPNKINAIYNAIEEVLSRYEVERIIERIMDEAVESMKQYQIREKIQSAVATLKSIDLEPLVNKVFAPLKELVNQLYMFDFKQMVSDMSAYFNRMVQKIKSFDYETFTMELSEKVTEMSKVPCFGKLYGEFRIISPDYSLRTTAELQNTTTTPVTPEFTMNMNSQATSTLDLLEHTLDASAHIAVPEMRRLTLSENIKAMHTAFTLDHQGTVTFYGLSAQATAKTTAKATTEPYKAELVSEAFLESGVSANMKTGYKHEVNMPLLNIFNEASFDQTAIAQLEDGSVRLTINNEGKGKYAFQDFSDEAVHKSDMEVVMGFCILKLAFTGTTESNHLRMNQNVDADICLPNHVIFNGKVETDTDFMKNSVAELKFQAKAEDLKIDVTASHNAELIGKVEGILANSVLAKLAPFELMFETRNKGNTKVAFPFQLSGKVDLQNDIVINLNSEVQQASWSGLARCNQYKYSHDFSVDNGEREVGLFVLMKGEANLDILREPLNIPAMTIPFFGVETPEVKEYSLWLDTGLSKFLITTQQTIDMDAKLKYTKNPEMITIDIDIEPVVDALNGHVKVLHKSLLIGKDKAVDILTKSYDNAKAEYEKYSMDMPKTITIPAYKLPMLNVEVSSFSMPLPDLSLITMPTLHVPSALSKLTFPKITLPRMQRGIMIPVLGDMTYEFSLKTAMITLKADAGLINQGDIVIRLDASSSSEFEVLNGKIEGTSTMNRDNGMKLASVLSVKHMMVEGNHESSITVNNEAMDASITNSAKLNLPMLTMEINQEMFGNPQEGLIVSVSSPSAGLIGLQVQTKRPAQVKGRLYGRYPSEPTSDVDIVAVKMSVMTLEKLSLQTTWNTEMPYEMMLGLKQKVPTVMSPEAFQEMVSDPISNAYNEISKFVVILKDYLEQAKEQGNVMFKRAADKIAELDFSKISTRVSDSAMFIVREYQKNIQIILDATIKFLRETKFQIPGFEEKMSGLEIYQTFSTFVADVSEEAIEKIPEYITSTFKMIIDYFRGIEFTFPGSSYVMRGEEILDDLSLTLQKIQAQVIVIVKKLGDIQLEDILTRLSEFTQISIEKTEELFNFLRSQDVDSVYAWLSDVYTDAINSRIVVDITKQVMDARNTVVEYISIVRAKLQDLLADMSIEQLHADIQAWIDSMVKRLNSIHNTIIELLKESTAKFEPYVRMSERQMDIDIPFPFIPKFE